MGATTTVRVLLAPASVLAAARAAFRSSLTLARWLCSLRFLRSSSSFDKFFWMNFLARFCPPAAIPHAFAYRRARNYRLSTPLTGVLIPRLQIHTHAVYAHQVYVPGSTEGRA
jgi:hypothetical protein